MPLIAKVLKYFHYFSMNYFRNTVNAIRTNRFEKLNKQFRVRDDKRQNISSLIFNLKSFRAFVYD